MLLLICLVKILYKEYKGNFSSTSIWISTYFKIVEFKSNWPLVWKSVQGGGEMCSGRDFRKCLNKSLGTPGKYLGLVTSSTFFTMSYDSVLTLEVEDTWERETH